MNLEALKRIPAVKTGNNFLASSHFQIGKEPQWLSHVDPLAYKSTFQKDYPPRKAERTGLANIPSPAFIMHKDVEKIRGKCSMTREEFVPAPSRDKPCSGKSLTKTNFKMDRDDRIDTFSTTHAHYYRTLPQEAVRPNSSKVPDHPMKSHIPQGDKEKESWPQSDYKQNFQQKSTTTRDKIINDTFIGPDTIKGDHRSHGCSGRFNTTSTRDYPPRTGHRKAMVPDHVQYPATTIPCGEPQRNESTHQVSFRGKFPSISALFDRNTALSKLQRTTFQNGDNRLDFFRTTTDDCYRYNTPTINTPVSQQIDMKKSNFPEGDQDPVRSAKRISSTITRSDYKPPPANYSNLIVDGSKKISMSSVSFGNDKNSHYQTTMDTNFPKKICSNEKHNIETTHSSIPLAYYDNVVSNSSYRIDYSPTTEVKKLCPNREALDNLRQSHIDHPIKGLREFSTTHSDTYTPKEVINPINMHTGRLQKSSIPIGTLNCY